MKALDRGSFCVVVSVVGGDFLAAVAVVSDLFFLFFFVGGTVAIGDNHRQGCPSLWQVTCKS